MKVRIVNERIAELNTVNSNVELPPEYLGTNLSKYLYDGQNWSIDPDYPDTPDWTGFNLAMVPPSSQSSFEVWLSQFKPTYQTALTVPAALGQLSETQTAYNTLKTLSAPTAEQIAEWQGIADQFDVGITF